jgi:hypothetical protein
MSDDVPPRVLEAEYRREFRELLARSSLGQPPPDPDDPAFIAEVRAAAAAYDWSDYFEETEEPHAG